jgi:dolichol-phosphate mannosyltransferase
MTPQAGTALSSNERAMFVTPHPSNLVIVAQHCVAPQLSLIVPTRNEAGNIDPLVSRLAQAFDNTEIEIIFVDDSSDDTPEVVTGLGPEAPCDVRLIARKPEERVGGLGGAVVAGMHAARGQWVCVMDADLQHPPELAPKMLDTALRAGADLVVASRYRDEGSASGLNNPVRKLVSQGSTLAARMLFWNKLRQVSDPMSGFFLVRRAALNLDTFHPRGFKVLLEIVVRTPGLRIAELAFEFGKRHAGESKASLREGLRYLSHLWSLRLSALPTQFIRFLMVGLSGLLVNSLVLGLATDLFGIYYLLSAVLATQSSTLWNFLLTEFWVFNDRQRSEGRLTRMVLFFTMNNAALLLRGPMIYALTSMLGIYYLLSNLISLIALMGIRYVFADNLIWRRKKQGLSTMYHYDIHGIITVASEVWLPELERFMVAETIAAPTMRVRLGKVKARANEPRARSFSYTEGLGSLGFGIDVTLGDTIEVTASPLLRMSPHVLYTNVVEPILRWTFVSKGFALVHGACIAFGSKAYLVTARTDTGKTTTILRLLSRQRRASDQGAFLSDDLTLISSDGQVMTYPKPMTISYHTVRAVNTAVLTRKEQLGLRLQSRIHSRSGRRFAMFLKRSKLPVATINTVVQLLVPPPKYHVDRLVPRTKVISEARLAGMFIIERGGEGEVQLDGQEALEVLMQNCEDAYGFPPYDSIKDFLFSANNLDLQATERAIVAHALSQHPTLVIRSTKMDWAQRMADMLTSSGATPLEEPRGRLEPTLAIG